MPEDIVRSVLDWLIEEVDGEIVDGEKETIDAAYEAIDSLAAAGLVDQRSGQAGGAE